MSSQRFAPEFKDEAVRQIVERGYKVSEVAERLAQFKSTPTKIALQPAPVLDLKLGMRHLTGQ